MLLIASVGSLFAYEPKTNETWTIDRGKGTYFGISYNDDNIFVSCQFHKRDKPQTVETQRSEDGAILVYDYEMRLEEIIKPKDFQLSNIHQIYCYKDKLYVTCSFDNSIAVYDILKNTWEKMIPEGIAYRDQEVNCHYNSIISKDGSLWITSNLKYGFNSQFLNPDNFLEFNDSEKWETEMIKVDPNTGKKTGSIDTTRNRGARLTHNLWEEDNKWYMCGSEGFLWDNEGNKVDLPDLKKSLIVGLPRGSIIQPVKNRKFIGVSEIAAIQDRHKGSNKILEFDFGWKLLKEYSFQNRGGLADMREPGIADLSHPSYLGKEVDIKYFSEYYN
jgi:hypothetical protein